MYKPNAFFLLLFSGAMLFLVACNNETERPLPDVSHIEAPLQIDRFDQAYFQADTNNFVDALQQLRTQYPSFAELFSVGIMEAGTLDTLLPPQVDYLRGFAASPVYRSVYDTVQQVFPNLDDTKEEMQQAMRYLRYYFPDYPAPERLVTFNSAFNYSAIIYGENELGVSLDMFLGPNFDYQRYSPNAPIFSKYLVRTYTKDHLTASLVRVILDDMLGDPPGNRLIDIMVHNGKKLYLLEQLLPETPDTVRFRTTPAQMEWLKGNERNLWAHLLTEDLLYATRYQDFRKLIEQSPNGSPVLPAESPGEAGNYVGYRIVKQFLTRNDALPLSELLVYRDAQEILESSKYKPDL